MQMTKENKLNQKQGKQNIFKYYLISRITNCTIQNNNNNDNKNPIGIIRPTLGGNYSVV